MKYLLLLLFTFKVFATTNCPKEHSLKNFKESVNFCISSEGHVVSKNCYVDSTCKWREDIKAIKAFIVSEQDLSGGKNPLSKKCDLAEREISIFRDKAGNEQTFCELTEGRYFSTTSLED